MLVLKFLQTKNWPKLAVLFSLLVFNSVYSLEAAESQAASLYQKLVLQKKESKWLKLLHYAPADKLGRSRADGKMFFIHPKGKKHADLELEATLLALKENKKSFGRFGLKARCAFPARFLFLRDFEELKGEELGSCPEFDNWKKEVNPESMSLIFSTAYPNNPASMFGHTFFRFNKKNKKNDLLDYGVSYEAVVDPKDPGVIYAYKGVFGGYPGLYDLTLYYQKVNEYVHGESRDLIEYELSLSQEKIDYLLAHIWEIYNTTHFDYYFTKENCSFHLAEALNVVLEESLYDPYRWYYLPADLVEAVHRQKGLVKKVSFRPSLKKRWLQIWNKLDESGKGNVEKAIESKKIVLGENPYEWEALIQKMQIDQFREKEDWDPKEKSFFKKVLNERAKRKIKGITLKETVLKNQPQFAHGPQKWELGGGVAGGKFRGILGFKSGYHDLLASDLGLEQFSELDFLEAQIIWDQKIEKVHYQKLNIINVTSLHFNQDYFKNVSWRAGARFEEIEFKDSLTDHHKFIGEGKLGLTWGNPRYGGVSLLGGVLLELSQKMEKGGRLGPGAHLLAFWSPVEWNKWLFESEWRMALWPKWSERDYTVLSLGTSFSLSRNWEWRMNVRRVSKLGSFEKSYDRYLGTLGVFF
jgi:hypothetical protein